MDENSSPRLQRVLDAIERGDVANVEYSPADIDAATTAEQKGFLDAIERRVESDLTVIDSLRPLVTALLEADDRAVRLTTAKLLVSLAETDPDELLTLVPTLAASVADEDEFYYVRARSAEALGYVALEHPDEVATPELLADLRIGLSFDEPEVKRKLAKALEHVALGDPRRVRHHVSSLADHLADDDELVRYHLCTALVVVGTESPNRLVDATDELLARVDDDCPFVRGRATEALGQLDSVAPDDIELPVTRLRELCDADESFVADRARFAVDGLDTNEISTNVGTVESVRETTADAAREIQTPATDGECPGCGLPLSVDGPPMCPQCGSPR